MKWIRLGVEKTVWKAQAEWFESTQLLPQRGKSCSVSGFALLSLRERNLARFAFHTAFSPLCLRQVI
jgi:hypothetical protein